MSDDNKALNGDTTSGEEATVATTPVAEAEAGSQSEGQSTESTDSSENTSSEEGQKKGANSRIRELNSQKKELEGTVASLSERIQGLTNSARGFQAPAYQPQVQDGGEITQEQYRQDVEHAGLSAAQLLIQQERNLTRIEREVDRAIDKHSELNPSSDSYDPEISATVTEATEAFIKSNPMGDVSKFISNQMKPYAKARSQAVGEATSEIAKQVASQATRPSSSVKAEQDFSNLSISEMEKKLGVVY